MTQQEYENKIKELQDELEQLKAAKIEAEQPKRWKPKCGETYSYITYEGRIWGTTWTNETSDNFGYLIGNCFKTKEEAEEYKKQIEYTARYKNYIEEHSKPIDWDNNNQGKYCASFMQNSPYTMRRANQLDVDRNYWRKCQGVIYASSEKIILDAIKEIGEDNFKKYVLGVK